LDTPERLSATRRSDGWLTITDWQSGMANGDEIVTAASAALDDTHPAMTNEPVSAPKFPALLPFHTEILKDTAVQNAILVCLKR